MMDINKARELYESRTDAEHCKLLNELESLIEKAVCRGEDRVTYTLPVTRSTLKGSVHRELENRGFKVELSPPISLSIPYLSSAITFIISGWNEK